MRSTASRWQSTLALSWLFAASIVLADDAPNRAMNVLAAARQAAHLDALAKLDAYEFTASGKGKMAGQPFNIERFTLRVDTHKGRFLGEMDAGKHASFAFDGHTHWLRLGNAPAKADANASTNDIIVARVLRASDLQDDPATLNVDWSRTEPCDGVTCDVLHFAPTGLPEYELWYRQTDHLLARLAVLGADRKAVYQESFLKWDALEGAPLPSHMVIDDGQMHYDLQGSMAAIGLPASFVLQGPASHWQFANGATQTRLPLQIIHDRIYITAMVNDQGPYYLMLDTGGTLILDKTRLAQLGLQSTGKQALSGVGWSGLDSSLVSISKLTLGDLQLQDWPTNAVDSNVMCGRIQLDYPCIGAIGGDLLPWLVLDLDFDHKVLTLVAPDQFIAPADKTRVSASLYGDHSTLIKGRIGDATARLLLDTGFTGNLAITDPFVDQQRLIYKLHTTRVVPILWGYGGGTYGRLTNLPQFELAGQVVTDKGTHLANADTGVLSSTMFDGLVGLGTLKRFNITIDLPGGVVYMARNSHFADKDTWQVPDSWLR
ncbi:hypothetical protein HNQ50_002436 [Silvimonas terrae]|uniref:Aspartyl protease n=1 Tax=Silvimonas terrae TaxID=300266 RepID=A0A840RHA6_9NEIS|nr:aspartyl protease family protein [Silvimonas terrae]MBB5191706.1 hypothetical protein [Silvimonas terrae]